MGNPTRTRRIVAAFLLISFVPVSSGFANPSLNDTRTLRVLNSEESPILHALHSELTAGLEEETYHLALVKGQGEDWWIHLHLRDFHLLGEETHRILFRLILVGDGKIEGLADPMAESFSGNRFGLFVPLRGVVPDKSLGWLLEAAKKRVMKRAKLLETAIRKNKYQVVLAQGAAQGSQGLYRMVRKKETPWLSLHTDPEPTYYRRLDFSSIPYLTLFQISEYLRGHPEIKELRVLPIQPVGENKRIRVRDSSGGLLFGEILEGVDPRSRYALHASGPTAAIFPEAAHLEREGWSERKILEKRRRIAAFTSRLREFLMADASANRFYFQFLSSKPRRPMLTYGALRLLNDWLSQTKISVSDAFFIALCASSVGEDHFLQPMVVRGIGKVLRNKTLSSKDLPLLSRAALDPLLSVRFFRTLHMSAGNRDESTRIIQAMLAVLQIQDPDVRKKAAQALIKVNLPYSDPGPHSAGLEEDVVVLHPDDPRHGDTYKRLFWAGNTTLEDRLNGLLIYLEELPRNMVVALAMVPGSAQEAGELAALGLEPLIEPGPVWEYLRRSSQWPQSVTSKAVTFQLLPPRAIQNFPALERVCIFPAYSANFDDSPSFSTSFKKKVLPLQYQNQSAPDMAVRQGVFSQLEKAYENGNLLVGVPYGLPTEEARGEFLRNVAGLTGRPFPPSVYLISQDKLRKRRDRSAARRHQIDRDHLIRNLSPEMGRIRQELWRRLRDAQSERVQPDAGAQEEIERRIKRLTPQFLIDRYPWQTTDQNRFRGQIRADLETARKGLEQDISHLPDRASPLAQHLFRVNRALDSHRWDELSQVQLGEATEGWFNHAPIGDSDELRQMDSLVLKIQALLKSRFPGQPAEEQFLRIWQAYAVGFLAALGKLSDRSALGFLQDPSALEFNTWVKWASTWAESSQWKLMPDQPLWVDALRVLSWMSGSGQVSEVDAQNWMESQEGIPEVLIRVIEFADGSSSKDLPPLDVGRVREVFQAVRSRLGAIPQELKVDLLLRRPAAIWNLGAAFLFMVSSVAKGLGREPAASGLWKKGMKRLGESLSLDSRYPLWEEKDLPDFLSRVNRIIVDGNWEGLIELKPFDHLPPLLIETFRRDFGLGKESVRLLNEMVEVIHGALHQPLPAERLRKGFRVLQAVAASCLSSSGRMTESTARLFAEDSLAAHILVWFSQLERWGRRSDSVGYNVLPFDILVGNGELPTGVYIRAYGLLLLVSRPDRLDDPKILDIWKKEETREIVKAILQWLEMRGGAQQGHPPVDVVQAVRKYNELIARVPEPPAQLIEGVLLKRPSEILNAALVFQELFVRSARELGFNQPADVEEGNLQRFLNEWVAAYPDQQLWWPWPNRPAGSSAGLGAGMEEGFDEWSAVSTQP